MSFFFLQIELGNLSVCPSRKIAVETFDFSETTSNASRFHVRSIVWEKSGSKSYGCCYCAEASANSSKASPRLWPFSLSQTYFWAWRSCDLSARRMAHRGSAEFTFTWAKRNRLGHDHFIYQTLAALRQKRFRTASWQVGLRHVSIADSTSVWPRPPRSAIQTANSPHSAATLVSKTSSLPPPI